MKSIYVALVTESLKARKSKMFWLSLVFFGFVASMMGLIMFIQQHPEISQKLGIIGTKASMLRFGEANWQNYFTLIIQGITAIGLIGYGFITSWVFGSEYSDRTIKDLLVLPVSRSSIVIAKLTVVTFWCIIHTFVFLIAALFFGYLSGVSGWSNEIILSGIYKFSMVSLLTMLLCTLIAFFASYSHGFMLPLGFVILTMIMANFVGLLGLGPYFPWAIPGLFTAPSGPENTTLTLTSYIILFLTNIAGLFGTIAWWKFADHK